MTLVEGCGLSPHLFETLFLWTYLANLVFCFLSSLFIAKGLAMCRLGGVIITQTVLFYTLITTGFEHFLHSNQPN